MYPEIEDLKKILLQENYISQADSKAAEAQAGDSASYVERLIRSQVLTKALLGQALAEARKLPYADLEANPPTKETIQRIPSDIAHQYRVVFVKESAEVAAVASDTPEKVELKKITEFFPGKKVRLAYALPEYIEASFNLYAQPLETRFSHIVERGERIAPEIVDEIIKEALTYKASDIHFEPQREEVIVRFRVDGNLREAGKLPKNYYENVLNRIKVESGMRIDEHLSAQDGSLQRRAEGMMADIRVSLVPTIEGEKVVMRILSSYIQGYNLADIGLSDAHRDLLERYASKPFGMILTVGPTGSGKTTTLYALLKMLNKPNVNITTIEDPVEYKMAGINQIQVRESSNLTFAKGLRAIVRQDPNIILVGEIRDHETAEISVNAALTGHLLLSTFHANDAATAVPRLIDMGIEPFLLASTLEAIVAQRLVRKICNQCRYSLPVAQALAELKNHAAEVSHYFEKTDNVYAGKGCSVCNNTGYVGRTAVYEMIGITPEMETLISKSPSAQEVEKLALAEGGVPMFVDGIAKVKRGITTISEVLRVVEPPRVSRK